MQYSQFCFLLCCIWCLLIEPAALVDRSGLSFYGNFQATFVAYSLGFGAAAACVTYAVYLLRVVSGVFVRQIRKALLVSAGCMFGLIVTPSFAPSVLHIFHIACAVVLFACQLWVGRALVISRYGLRIEHAVFLIQCVACLVILLSYGRVVPAAMMLPAQVAAGLTFSILVTRTLSITLRKQPEVIVLPPAVIEEDVLREEPSGSL